MRSMAWVPLSTGLLLSVFLCGVGRGQSASPGEGVARSSAEAARAGPPTFGRPLFRWVDYDGDGLLDLYAIDGIGPGRLLHNLGNGLFEDMTERLGFPDTIAARDVLWEDFDLDGWPDLILLFHDGSLRLLWNEGGTALIEITASAGLQKVQDAVAVLPLDYDADGLVDLHVTTASGTELYRNCGASGFLFVGPPGAPFVPGAPVLAATCSDSIKDQATGTCIQASSIPVDGMLYPLCEDLFVTPTGDVGMGTRTPHAKLHVDSLAFPTIGITSRASNDPAALLVTNDNGETLQIGVNNSGHPSADRAFVWSSSDLRIGTGGGQRLLVAAGGTVEVEQNLVVGDPSGVVGDPIVTPDLEVFNRATASLRLATADGSWTRLQLYEKGSGDQGYGFEFIYDGNEDRLKLYSRTFSGNDAQRMTWHKNGNVGIGTNLPSEKLEVAGNVFIQDDLHVQGRLSKGSGSFRIDHPLDPANRYLSHSFVESPDMMNVYNGNVVLDENGEAWVEMPDWFEPLNRDFRYQLTCIGAFAPVYIAREVEGNRFQIAGGTPSGKVSWQVTGIRQDPFAEAYPIEVEEEKPASKRGTYLHPELYEPGS